MPVTMTRERKVVTTSATLTKFGYRHKVYPISLAPASCKSLKKSKKKAIFGRKRGRLV